MDINKVNWTNSEERLTISFPIAKVDKAKRTVSGFATLDNLDRHGDIVTPDASEKAFARFRGNLREMHQPLAVGKVVKFVPQDFIDKDSGKTYKGIYVDAYISKGAEDTWEKVLDGTLTGFSIGGNIVEAGYQAGDSDKDTRVIKDYELMELSLVDNPANPLANIFSIQKSADGMTMKGMATEVVIENVFWCAGDQIATTSQNDEKNCVVCGDAMNTIGWVETSDANKSAVVKKLIQGQFVKDDAPGPDHAATTQDGDAITSQDTINLYPDQDAIKKSDTVITITSNLLSKGGNEEMADENDELEAAPVDEAVEEAVEEVEDETVDEAVEKAAHVSEVPLDELDFVKMVDELKTAIKKTIKKNYAETAATASDMYRAVDENRDAITKSLEDFNTKHTELSNNVAELVQKVDEITKRLDGYEGATAVKKSGEVEQAASDNTKITKGNWAGHFLGVNSF